MTASEALRKMAWLAFENANDLFDAARRETWSGYHDCLNAEASAWKESALALLAESESIEKAGLR